MTKFQFVRLCAVSLLIFTCVECAVELANLPNQLQAMASFDLQKMTYSMLGIELDISTVDESLNSQGLVEQSASLFQRSAGIVLTLFLLTCQLLGAIGLLITNRESLGRIGRFSVRIWIFFSALALVSTVVPVVASVMTAVDNSVEQKLAEGVDSANETLLSEYPVIVEALELLQSADVPQSFYTRIYLVLVISTLVIYAFLAFMAIKMWRDAKKFRYS